MTTFFHGLFIRLLLAVGVFVVAALMAPFFVVALVAAALTALCGSRQYVLNLLLASDHMVNACLLGDPNDTLSQRTARWSEQGNRTACWICRQLNVLSPNHCKWSLTPGTIAREIWPKSK